MTCITLLSLIDNDISHHCRSFSMAIAGGKGLLCLRMSLCTHLSALGGTAFSIALGGFKGQWLGFGDVKLAFLLGLLVGPAHVFSFVVLSFLDWCWCGLLP